MQVNGTSGTSLLPVIPLKEKVIFPKTLHPVVIGRSQSVNALNYAHKYSNKLIFAAQKVAEIKEPAPDDIFKIGTIAAIVKYNQLPNQTVKILVNGYQRVEIVNYSSTDPCFMVEYRELKSEIPPLDVIENVMQEIQAAFQEYITHHPRIPKSTIDNINWQKDPEQYLNTIASLLPLKLDDAQKLLENMSFARQLEDVFEHLVSSIEMLKLEQKLKGRVKAQVENSQKQWYLNEQMKAIQKELGKENIFHSDIEELKKKLESLP